MKTAYLGFLHESLIRIAQPHSTTDARQKEGEGVGRERGEGKGGGGG
eukprot:COSAG02_NODE_75872_length_140_cov_467.951220_1_plen_46_part_11